MCCVVIVCVVCVCCACVCCVVLCVLCCVVLCCATLPRPPPSSLFVPFGACSPGFQQQARSPSAVSRNLSRSFTSSALLRSSAEASAALSYHSRPRRILLRQPEGNGVGEPDKPSTTFGALVSRTPATPATAAAAAAASQPGSTSALFDPSTVTGSPLMGGPAVSSSVFREQSPLTLGRGSSSRDLTPKGFRHAVYGGSHTSSRNASPEAVRYGASHGVHDPHSCSCDAGRKALARISTPIREVHERWNGPHRSCAPAPSPAGKAAVDEETSRDALVFSAALAAAEALAQPALHIDQRTAKGHARSPSPTQDVRSRRQNAQLDEGGDQPEEGLESTSQTSQPRRQPAHATAGPPSPQPSSSSDLQHLSSEEAVLLVEEALLPLELPRRYVVPKLRGPNRSR